MKLFTSDYLEYYLTLVAWVVNNGIWQVLVASGVFALPFAAIILQEWQRPAGTRPGPQQHPQKGNRLYPDMGRHPGRCRTKRSPHIALSPYSPG